MLSILLFSDCLISALEPCEPVPFATDKMGRLPVDIWLILSRLSGFTSEVRIMLP